MGWVTFGTSTVRQCYQSGPAAIVKAQPRGLDENRAESCVILATCT